MFRRKKFDGQVFAVYLICYAVLRSFVEYFRGDYPCIYLRRLGTPAQLVSMGIFSAAFAAVVPPFATAASPARRSRRENKVDCRG